jgi:hypothetical protein
MKLISLREDNGYLIKTPYGDKQGYKIYLVDGETVRNSSNSAEEFGGVAIHSQFPDLIPKDEIWIEKDSSKNEIPLLVDTALYQLKQIAAGKSKDEAYAGAIRREKMERAKADYAARGHRVSNHILPRDIYIKLYRTLADGTKVWLVNGEEVRNHTKTDFIEGGHDYVYDFIPDGEVWLEDGLNADEMPYILYHEVTERKLMKDKNMDYDSAHEIASEKEFKMRHNTK